MLLDEFEFELCPSGRDAWATFRANEHPVADYALGDARSVRAMLVGRYVTVRGYGGIWRCRLTPAAWLQ